MLVTRNLILSLYANDTYHPAAMSNPMLRKIFYVDDDVDDVLLFREAMQEIDVHSEVVTAENGIRMLALLQEDITLPDVIFLDMNMPFKNGIECLQDIKSSAQWEHIPVVMLSTSAEPTTIRKALDSGAYRYIQKPAYFALLRDAIRQCLLGIARME
jgi:CheY-like chemotaxis protein